MTLQERLMEDLKSAMRAGDEVAHDFMRVLSELLRVLVVAHERVPVRDHEEAVARLLQFDPVVDGAHEVAGVGIIAPDKDGKPVLHIHAALGRSGETITGCLRPGVTTWLVGEAIIYEITGATARRMPDKASGFDLMEI